MVTVKRVAKRIFEDDSGDETTMPEEEDVRHSTYVSLPRDPPFSTSFSSSSILKVLRQGDARARI